MLDAEGILKLADKLESAARNPHEAEIKKLEEAIADAAKAFCGSWLGYHSRIYYADLQPIPPGARFSTEWGLGDRISNETVGDWDEFDTDTVEAEIFRWADDPDEDKIKEDADTLREFFEESQAQIQSALSRYKIDHAEDTFLQDIIEKIENIKCPKFQHFVDYYKPKGQVFTRDTVAIGQGFVTPAHIRVAADVLVWKTPYTIVSQLAKLARRAASHLMSLDKKARKTSRIGTHVFIGHGRSPAWKDLRDFIQDRVKLPYDEFNRVPVAGISTSARLSQMLDDAAIAFLILTAEDEQKDGKLHPRMNVIHEAGLFQGRLGLERAIILLEEGCDEFSNISGLGQIRFPKGDIAHVFEEIRRVLEREELIDEA